MITTPTVSGKPGQAPTGLSCDLYPLIGSHSTWTDPRGPVSFYPATASGRNARIEGSPRAGADLTRIVRCSTGRIRICDTRLGVESVVQVRARSPLLTWASDSRRPSSPRAARSPRVDQVRTLVGRCRAGPDPPALTRVDTVGSAGDVYFPAGVVRGPAGTDCI
jgi:hypothetical protein